VASIRRWSGVSKKSAVSMTVMRVPFAVLEVSRLWWQAQYSSGRFLPEGVRTPAEAQGSRCAVGRVGIWSEPKIG
jgi:hypothetical protein